MPINGIILESYARSAGTGDQPVIGTVTSRRNSSRHERQALLRKRQEEDEKMRKLKEEQDQIAKILAHKWAEEDRKRTEKSEGTRRRRDDRSRSRERRRPRAREESVEPEPAPPPEEEEEAAPRVGGWISIDRGADKEEKQVQQQQLEVARPKASTMAVSSSSKARRFTEGSFGGSVAFTAEGRSVDVKAETANKAHSKKVANVFGFGVEEEEDDDVARREMELAARSKRAKLSLHDNKALGASGGSRREASEDPMPSAGGAAPGKRPTDMCQQLMAMAAWKRSCGGKRLPMPKGLEADVSKAMGGPS